jgi:hypothetical protein
MTAPGRTRLTSREASSSSFSSLPVMMSSALVLSQAAAIVGAMPDSLQ